MSKYLQSLFMIFFIAGCASAATCSGVTYSDGHGWNVTSNTNCSDMTINMSWGKTIKVFNNSNLTLDGVKINFNSTLRADYPNTRGGIIVYNGILTIRNSNFTTIKHDNGGASNQHYRFYIFNRSKLILTNSFINRPGHNYNSSAYRIGTAGIDINNSYLKVSKSTLNGSGGLFLYNGAKVNSSGFNITNSFYGVNIYKVNNVNISNINIYNSNNSGLFVEYTNGGSIQNILINKSESSGVHILKTVLYSIIKLNSSYSKSDGFSVVSSNITNITNVRFTNNNGSGMVFMYSDPTVTQMVTYICGKTCVRVYHSTVAMVDSAIEGSSLYGIMVDGTSHFTYGSDTVISNNALGNYYSGESLDLSGTGQVNEWAWGNADGLGGSMAGVGQELNANQQISVPGMGATVFQFNLPDYGQADLSSNENIGGYYTCANVDSNSFGDGCFKMGLATFGYNTYFTLKGTDGKWFMVIMNTISGVSRKVDISSNPFGTIGKVYAVLNYDKYVLVYAENICGCKETNRLPQVFLYDQDGNFIDCKTCTSKGTASSYVNRMWHTSWNVASNTKPCGSEPLTGNPTEWCYEPNKAYAHTWSNWSGDFYKNHAQSAVHCADGKCDTYEEGGMIIPTSIIVDANNNIFIGGSAGQYGILWTKFDFTGNIVARGWVGQSDYSSKCLSAVTPIMIDNRIANPCGLSRNNFATYWINMAKPFQAPDQYVSGQYPAGRVVNNQNSYNLIQTTGHQGGLWAYNFDLGIFQRKNPAVGDDETYIGYVSGGKLGFYSRPATPPSIVDTTKLVYYTYSGSGDSWGSGTSVVMNSKDSVPIGLSKLMFGKDYGVIGGYSNYMTGYHDLRTSSIANWEVYVDANTDAMSFYLTGDNVLDWSGAINVRRTNANFMTIVTSDSPSCSYDDYLCSYKGTSNGGLCNLEGSPSSLSAAQCALLTDVGDACSANNQCKSNYCYNSICTVTHYCETLPTSPGLNTCQLIKLDGESCSRNAECKSGKCLNGTYMDFTGKIAGEYPNNWWGVPYLVDGEYVQSGTCVAKTVECNEDYRFQRVRINPDVAYPASVAQDTKYFSGYEYPICPFDITKYNEALIPSSQDINDPLFNSRMTYCHLNSGTNKYKCLPYTEDFNIETRNLELLKDPLQFPFNAYADVPVLEWAFNDKDREYIIYAGAEPDSLIYIDTVTPEWNCVASVGGKCTYRLFLMEKGLTEYSPPQSISDFYTRIYTIAADGLEFAPNYNMESRSEYGDKISFTQLSQFRSGSWKGYVSTSTTTTTTTTSTTTTTTVPTDMTCTLNEDSSKIHCLWKNMVSATKYSVSLYKTGQDTAFASSASAVLTPSGAVTSYNIKDADNACSLQSDGSTNWAIGSVCLSSRMIPKDSITIKVSGFKGDSTLAGTYEKTVILSKCYNNYDCGSSASGYGTCTNYVCSNMIQFVAGYPKVIIQDNRPVVALKWTIPQIIKSGNTYYDSNEITYEVWRYDDAAGAVGSAVASGVSLTSTDFIDATMPVNLGEEYWYKVIAKVQGTYKTDSTPLVSVVIAGCQTNTDCQDGYQCDLPTHVCISGGVVGSCAVSCDSINSESCNCREKTTYGDETTTFCYVGTCRPDYTDCTSDTDCLGAYPSKAIGNWMGTGNPSYACGYYLDNYEFTKKHNVYPVSLPTFSKCFYKMTSELEKSTCLRSSECISGTCSGGVAACTTQAGCVGGQLTCTYTPLITKAGDNSCGIGTNNGACMPDGLCYIPGYCSEGTVKMCNYPHNTDAWCISETGNADAFCNSYQVAPDVPSEGSAVCKTEKLGFGMDCARDSWCQSPLTCVKAPGAIVGTCLGAGVSCDFSKCNYFKLGAQAESINGVLFMKGRGGPNDNNCGCGAGEFCYPKYPDNPPSYNVGLCQTLLPDGAKCGGSGRPGDKSNNALLLPHGDWLCSSFNCIGDEYAGGIVSTGVVGVVGEIAGVCQPASYDCVDNVPLKENIGGGVIGGSGTEYRDPENYCHASDPSGARGPDIDNIPPTDIIEAVGYDGGIGTQGSLSVAIGHVRTTQKWCFNQPITIGLPTGVLTPDHKCYLRYENGAVCEKDYQCKSDNCKNGFCGVAIIDDQDGKYGDPCTIRNLDGNVNIKWNALENKEYSKGTSISPSYWSDTCSDQTESLFCNPCNDNGFLVDSPTVKCSAGTVKQGSGGTCKRANTDGQPCYSNSQCSTVMTSNSDGQKQLVCGINSQYPIPACTSATNKFCIAGMEATYNKFCYYTAAGGSCNHDSMAPPGTFNKKLDEQCYFKYTIGELPENHFFCNDMDMCYYKDKPTVTFPCSTVTDTDLTKISVVPGNCDKNYCPASSVAKESSVCWRDMNWKSADGSKVSNAKVQLVYCDGKSGKLNSVSEGGRCVWKKDKGLPCKVGIECVPGLSCESNICSELPCVKDSDCKNPDLVCINGLCQQKSKYDIRVSPINGLVKPTNAPDNSLDYELVAICSKQEFEFKVEASKAMQFKYTIVGNTEVGKWLGDSEKVVSAMKIVSIPELCDATLNANRVIYKIVSVDFIPVIDGINDIEGTITKKILVLARPVSLKITRCNVDFPPVECGTFVDDETRSKAFIIQQNNTYNPVKIAVADTRIIMCDSSNGVGEDYLNPLYPRTELSDFGIVTYALADDWYTQKYIRCMDEYGSITMATTLVNPAEWIFNYKFAPSTQVFIILVLLIAVPALTLAAKSRSK